jgi:Na+/H+ antiporter NhaD/arsenite permease-like protein
MAQPPQGPAAVLDFTRDSTGIAALVAFGVGCAVMIAERPLDLRRSKPMLLAAASVWLLAAFAYGVHGDTQTAGALVRSSLLGLTELLLFVLVTMTYVNAMEERGLFAMLRGSLVGRNASLRGAYWATGAAAFVLAPLTGDLATSMLMTSMVLAIGNEDRRFVSVGCINVVIAANAGGVCSPFGDLTTLLAWQHGTVELYALIALCLPALVAWLIPAAVMSATLPVGLATVAQERPRLERGARVIAALFGLTIAMAAIAHELLHLPPVVGMMAGLALLAMWGYALKRREQRARFAADVDLAATALDLDRVLREEALARRAPFDVNVELQRADWDTLLYCYGAVLAVGGLGALGYAALGSHLVYGGQLAPATANALYGLASGAIDNLLGMLFALQMSPDLNADQWLFLTLAIGIGGSLTSFGSVVGIVAMRRARDLYRIADHLKWSWAIALGYAASLGLYALLRGGTAG